MRNGEVKKVTSSSSSILKIGLLSLFLCAVSPAEINKCPSPWFGSACQYKCHCKGVCYNDGQCEDGCERGWFGPQCQYEDIATLFSSGSATLIDGDDSTCNCNRNNQNLTTTLTWKTPQPITWMRIVVTDYRNIDLLRSLDIRLLLASRTPTLQCYNKKVTVANSVSMDFHCDKTAIGNQITLTGAAVPFICSIYVTGGRNVALHQPTFQSSLYADYLCDESCSLPQNAVDGSTNGYLYSKSCTHTNSENKPWWKLNFTRPYYISKYRLFNRDAHMSRLQNFSISSWNSGKGIFNYTDQAGKASPNYTVIHSLATANVPVKSVVVMSLNQFKILTLCEFEVFGDSVCAPRTYGRDCELTCNCRNKSETCLVSTGGCTSGCDDGTLGSGCSIACEPTFYGKDCTNQCDERCLNQLCNNINGQCLQCLPGRAGVFCEQSCPVNTYGEACSKNCSIHCDQDGQCDPATGVCNSGCKDGYTGPLCIDKCDDNTYGSNCSLSCSQYCKSDDNISPDICHHFNGHCVHGCLPGYDGWQCNRACAPTFYGDECQSQCSANCLDQLCDNINGRCRKCPIGKTGLFCENGDCHSPFYGSNCREVCSKNCLIQACNTSGYCLECPPGKTGDMCDRECESTFYGQDCSQRCNIGCLNQMCNSTTGLCLKCPQLRSGPFCELNSTEEYKNDSLNLGCNITNGQFMCASTADSHKKDCGGFNSAAIILAVFLGAFMTGAVIVMIILWRKYHIGSKYLLCMFKYKSRGSPSDQETFTFQQDEIES